VSGEDVYSNNGAWEKTCNFYSISNTKMQAMWKVTLAVDVISMNTETLGLGGSKFVRRQNTDITRHCLNC
jgi:hypothetical protein